MSKPLSEMTREELWHLFPIFLTEHQACWEAWYDEEHMLLSSILPQYPTIQISHIGSTAVQRIWAKPIIDILVQITEQMDMQAICDIFTENGYLCMSRSDSRISFNKGYTASGFAEKVFHLHLRYAGDNDELYFRDYLNEHADVAEEYEKLKLALWKTYEYDRDGYTDAKTAFISEITRKAKAAYAGRYM
ncbi:MAG: GrpB family protein [Eubacteriales bacterium]|nr:GrpB family protein [Eubacteriales bacterium]